MNTHLLAIYYSIYTLLGKRFYQLGTGGDTERLHACMGSPVYDEEAEVDHRCLITSNVGDVLSYDSKM